MKIVISLLVLAMFACTVQAGCPTYIRFINFGDSNETTPAPVFFQIAHYTPNNPASVTTLPVPFPYGAGRGNWWFVPAPARVSISVWDRNPDQNPTTRVLLGRKTINVGPNKAVSVFWTGSWPLGPTDTNSNYQQYPNSNLWTVLESSRPIHPGFWRPVFFNMLDGVSKYDMVILDSSTGREVSRVVSIDQRTGANGPVIPTGTYDFAITAVGSTVPVFNAARNFSLSTRDPNSGESSIVTTSGDMIEVFLFGNPIGSGRNNTGMWNVAGGSGAGTFELVFNLGTPGCTGISGANAL